LVGLQYLKVKPDYLIELIEDPSLFDPIPLTPEILEACGFKDGVIVTRYEAIIVKEYKTTTQGVFKGKWCMMLCDSIPYQLQHHFQYLHELQNLFFALTGKELEVKLAQPLHNT
jgi:hypothetical protein